MAKLTVPTNSALAAAVLLSLVALAGCNTMEGAGQDIQSGGEALEDSAEDTRESM